MSASLTAAADEAMSALFSVGGTDDVAAAAVGNVVNVAVNTHK